MTRKSIGPGISIELPARYPVEFLQDLVEGLEPNLVELVDPAAPIKVYIKPTDREREQYIRAQLTEMADEYAARFPKGRP